MRTDSHRWVQIARDEALIRQHNRCKYCDSLLRRSDATADHYNPQAKFGSNEKHNIVAACEPCNVAKGSLHGDEFIKLIRQKVPKTHRHGVHVRAAVRRIELASQAAQSRILALVGLRFDRSDIY